MQRSDELELSTGTLGQRPAAGSASKAAGSVDARRLCAYNQTRECFLGLEVDSADLSLAKLKDRIASLSLKSGEGLWLAPFRGLPEWGIRVPLDLLYLDQDSRVIDVVESYPVFRANASTPQPASVLALPTHSIYSSQTQVGDQLVLCVAEEMQQRLERSTSGTTTSSGTAAPSGPIPIAPRLKRAPAETHAPLPAAPKRAANSVVQSAVLLREQPLWSGGPGLLEIGKAVPEEESPKTRQTHLMGLIQPEMKDARPPRGWLERWWSPDPRKAPRESAPGLAAYYWTGGPPEAHAIKDVSSSGLYVVTEERWYPGTLVLMTLQATEMGEEVQERTLCVHCRAVRWGKDGVGLQFVVQKDDGDPTMAAADRKALDRFLQRLKKSRR